MPKNMCTCTFQTMMIITKHTCAVILNTLITKLIKVSFVCKAVIFFIPSIIFVVSSNSEFYECAWLKTMIWYFEK